MATEEGLGPPGTVLVTGLDCGPQWCLCGYMGSLRDTRALKICDADDNQVALVAIWVG